MVTCKGCEKLLTECVCDQTKVPDFEPPKMRLVLPRRPGLVRLYCECGMACIVGATRELTMVTLAARTKTMMADHRRSCRAFKDHSTPEVKG